MIIEISAIIDVRIDLFISKLSNEYDLPIEKLREIYLRMDIPIGIPTNFPSKNIRLGLCCINTILRKQKPPVFCSRNLIKRTWTLEKAQSLALQNIADIGKMIEWNSNNHISLLRISSDIFPRFTDINTVGNFTIDFARPLLAKIGEIIKQKNHRVLMHPGQYNQVGAIKQSVFDSTIIDLSHHADILDALGTDPKSSIIIIHGGGTYGNKKETISRWIDQYKLLPEKIKRRLALENCERGYSVKDCLYICEKLGIPMIFDSHHYSCYNILNPEEQITESELINLFPRIIATWKGEIPIMHISEQGEGRIGHHSDYIEKIPNYFFRLGNIDLEVEAKAKEQAIFKLYEKYGRENFRV
jgi:UV DNA damage endonuclease